MYHALTCEVTGYSTKSNNAAPYLYVCNRPNTFAITKPNSIHVNARKEKNNIISTLIRIKSLNINLNTLTVHSEEMNI